MLRDRIVLSLWGQITALKLGRGNMWDDIITFLSKVETILKNYAYTLGCFVTLSGWICALWLKFNNRKVSLLLKSEKSSVFIYNDSSMPIEVTNCTLEIYNMLRKSEFAQKHGLIVSPCGLIQPRHVEILFIIGKQIENVIEQIWKPTEEQMKQYENQIVTEHHAAIDICITYKKATSNKLILKKFKRVIGGHPAIGWGIGYSPYHFRKGRREAIERFFKFVLFFIKSPRASLEHRKCRKRFQQYLDVVGIVAALRDKVLTEKEVEKKLEKLLGKKGNELAKEVEGILRKPEGVLDPSVKSDDGKTRV